MALEHNRSLIVRQTDHDQPAKPTTPKVISRLIRLIVVAV
jgi:hypothetical protein